MIVLLLQAVLSAPMDSGGARPPSDTMLVLPEVRVERARPLSETRRRLPSGFVTEISAGSTGRAIETLADALALAPGARVTQYGGLGAFSTVSLRGAPPGQVAVYLDGAPIQSAAGGVVNLADLPFSPVERVEVWRGASPMSFGAPTPGGAIQLVTRAAPSALSMRVTRGSFDTWESRAGGGRAFGPVSLMLDGGYQGSAGTFSYFDDNGTPFNASDDSTSTRSNNRLDATNALAAVQWRAPGAFRLAAREHYLHKAQGVPGVGAVPALHPRSSLDRSLTQLELTRGAHGRTPALAARASWQRDRSRFRDTEGELRAGHTDSDNRASSENQTLDAAWPGAESWVSLDGALSHRDERFVPHDAASPVPDPPVSERHAVGAAAGLTLTPWRGPLSLRAARRWDRVEDSIARTTFGVVAVSDVAREFTTPQLGARLAAPLGLELRANWTDAARVPTFNELFGDVGSVMGNPTLVPERGENWDAGARWDAPGRGAWRGYAEYAHFSSHAEDLIVYLKSSVNAVKASNVSAAEIDGDELSARLDAPGGFALSGAATWMRAVDRGKVKAWYGKRLPQRPDRQASARLDWRRAGVRASANLDYLSANYLDPANRQRVSDRTLFGLSVSAPIRGDVLRVTLDGRNLGDRRVADVGGFPLPGRTVFLACEARFGAADAPSR